MAADVDNIDWKSLANRLGARYIAGPYHDPHRLEVPHGAITIYVDMRTFSRGSGSVELFGPKNGTLFRVRVPYVSKDRFSLHVRRKTWLSRLLPSVKTEDEKFDALFRLTTNNTSQSKRLLSFTSLHCGDSFGERSIMQRLMHEERLYIKVTEPAAWEDDRRFVSNVQEMRFQQVDLSSLHEYSVLSTMNLVRSVLDCLLAMGSARDINPVRRER